MDDNKVITIFKKLLDENIKDIQNIVTKAELLQVTNEQFYIDYEIKVSQLATKDHNK